VRKILPIEKVNTEAKAAIAGFHADVIGVVEEAIAKNEWVVVGMAQNPVVKSARRLLDGAAIKFHYVEYGSYFSEWKKRLAIKLWSGWPTFPQVFYKGVLIGGADDLKKYLATQAFKSKS
jgi:monothiol glutaredoxin